MSSPATPPPLGSRLLGSPVDNDPSGQHLRVQALLTACVIVANVVGVIVVVALIFLVIPGGSITTRRLSVVNAILGPAYVCFALATGVLYGTYRSRRALRWALDGENPTPDDLRATLLVPRNLTVLQGLLWAVAVALFTGVYAVLDPHDAARVGFPIAYGGVVVCANAYLAIEFSLRPIAARALLAGEPVRSRVLGVRGRIVLAWMLGSATPVAGLMTVALFALQRHDVSAHRVEVTVIVLGAVTLVFGLLLTWLGANAIVEPLRGLGHGLRDIGDGRFDTRVVVYDATELGELQSGFNAMASGLGEREQLRDLFGRHVGRDVADAALSAPPELGGEERHVAALFIDLVGSTTLAEQNEATDVVTLLNRFFGVVVDEVERHHGFVNKFQGDGALAVFGAPLPSDDPSGGALAAARAIAARLHEELPDCRFGTGVCAGTAVAGHVGDSRRFEYTVIGDPVNQAARLADLAKKDSHDVLASQATVDDAHGQEGTWWTQAGQATLRGRSEPTHLMTPSTEPPAVQ